MPTDDLDRFCCQNPDCPDHGRRGAGNLSVCGHYGRAHHRLLYCRTCKARSSEFKGTPLFNSKLPHDTVLAILQHLADGCGVRQTAQTFGDRDLRDSASRLLDFSFVHSGQRHQGQLSYVRVGRRLAVMRRQSPRYRVAGI
jgi:hypothetical protein